MSDNETVVETPDDLNAFEDLFYGRATPEEKVEEQEEVKDEADDEESEVDDAAPEESDDEADPDESEEDEADEKPRRNRKTAKERIQELNERAKEAERQLAIEREVNKRLKEAEDKPKPSEQKVEVDTVKAPDPDAVNDKGEPLYPLGEFDPAFIRAQVRFTIEQETAMAEKAQAEKRQQLEAQQAREKQQEAWVERLEKAEAELPDVREKIGTLAVMFEGLDQNYGQFLVDVVQSLDNGPAILHYLADNPKEAKSIVNSGATVATLSLGRLDAQLAAEISRAEKKAVKVSKAPEPPKHTPRGGGGKFTVAGDTDDLDAFSEEFFKRKK